MIITLDSELGPVPFEVDEGSNRAVRGAGTPNSEHLSEKLESALAVVGRVAESVRQSLQHASIGSAEVTIGVKLTAEAGFIVAKTAAEATLSVKLVLEGPRKTSPQQLSLSIKDAPELTPAAS